jgi:alkyl hydroperoxide reductase subunit F
MDARQRNAARAIGCAQQAHVRTTRHGEIEVDARGQTSVPGVFAAGDVTTVPFKQIVIAAGEGSKAALGAFDHLIRSSAPA